jgi:cytochrome P450
VYKIEFDALRKRMSSGVQKPCFMSQFIETGKHTEFKEDELLFLASALMEAGTDTTRESLDQFLAAAIVWPDWVKRCRDELDRICGANAERLPTAQDAPNLPLIKAAVKEVIRWKYVNGTVAKNTTRS